MKRLTRRSLPVSESVRNSVNCSFLSSWPGLCWFTFNSIAVNLQTAPNFNLLCSCCYSESRKRRNCLSLCQLSIRLDQTVAELKKQLTTVVQLSTNSMRLYYIDKGSAFGPEEMKYNTRALHSYSIQDGDEILVVPKTKWTADDLLADKSELKKNFFSDWLTDTAK